MKYLCSVFILLVLIPLTACAQNVSAENDMRSLRVDPAYFADLYPHQLPSVIAKTVIANAKKAGVNTIFLYAYSAEHGAFYQTDYPFTEIEEHMGVLNAFAYVVDEAKAANIKVIAVTPVNDFRIAWLAHPEWRSKLQSGADYKPFARTFHLSAWHPEFREWFKGYVHDLLTRFPSLTGIEAVEPTVDCLWTGEPDYNPAVITEFRRRYPQSPLGGNDWNKVRALGITQLVAIVSKAAHQHKMISGVVQTWPAYYDGTLMSPATIRDSVGFDFDGVLNLQGDEKLDFVIGEFLWQQWAGEYGGNIFTPAWTRYAANEFLKFIDTRSVGVLHVEISPWTGQHSTVTPTVQEFADTLKEIRDMGAAIDVYDHSQIERRQAWDALLQWVTTDNTTGAE
ncbi:hypothetical protein [Bdellovibrio sp. NC01]|uniref:hypothetical protein n=1 Tax=Bdellovibrio sp. NC01 TaxID=2220073 RepID=UPI00115BF871|nr:hypothetical protein [Bdellovibrio sp. NC01]QDK38684.1 hypothetical protein DOE51_14365 [Bdellovibrio sp. NC01]